MQMSLIKVARGSPVQMSLIKVTRGSPVQMGNAPPPTHNMIVGIGLLIYSTARFELDTREELLACNSTF